MQDVDKPVTKVCEREGELVRESEADVIVEVGDPLNDDEMNESNIVVDDSPDDSPSSIDDDGKTIDALIRKNSIHDRNMRVEMEEKQNETTDEFDPLPVGLRNLSSQQPTSGVLLREPNETEVNDSEYEPHESHKREKELTTDPEDDSRVVESADEAPEILVQRMSTESTSATGMDFGTRNTSSLIDAPNRFAGMTALTTAIDRVNAQDELAQLRKPELDNGVDGAETSSGSKSTREKTELEREMELYEAAERELEAHLLASMRSDQPTMAVDASAEGSSLKDILNERKRTSDSIPNEARKKRGKRLLVCDDSKEEEDVCFICFDGGELVLCDRRTCPKAYHLNCIGRDAAFFQKKGAWICGWHFCSICTKPANFQCYACPTAYCSGCLNKAEFLCVRQRKGLCEDCWPIVNMIENKEAVNAEGIQVDFTDVETYECLFKEYWEDLKLRLSFTVNELDKDAKAGAGNEAFFNAVGSDDDNVDAEDYSTGSENEVDGTDVDIDAFDGSSKRKKKRGKGKAQLFEDEDVDIDVEDDAELEVEPDFESENEEVTEGELGEEDDDEDVAGKPDLQPREFEGWASKELIEFVKFMNEDPKKPLSRFQVTKLLWSYIKSQKLQDPRKKTQIVCDDRLRTIFGKKNVGQSEMFKHLQAHFAPKGGKRYGRQLRDDQASAEDATDADGSAPDERFTKMKDVKDKRRKRKGDEDKFERPNVDEFAAVTPKNIGLIYLRRQLLEELLDDAEFDSKVCNTFVRIRVPGMSSKSEMCYRLVQVVGTRLQADEYKAGRKFTNIVLEILNLQKREDVTVDLVSNHDFNEEECQRLRQSIKCGFIKTLTVGDVEDKARSLQEAKVNDWFETERQRLVNLRDRASEKGRKKELRECVEKLQELNSPAFRAAKLHARPEVTADPRMDPNYESDGNDDKSSSAIKDGVSTMLEKSPYAGGNEDKARGLGLLKNSSIDSSRPDWEGQRNKHPTWVGSHRSKDVERAYPPVRSGEKVPLYNRAQLYGVESASGHGYDERDRGWDKDWTTEREPSGDAGWIGNGKSRAAEKWNEKIDLSINVDGRSGRNDYRGITGMTTPVFDTKSDWRQEQATPAAPSVQSSFSSSSQNILSPAAIEAAEKEKIWHYMDPTGTVQGPFGMEQLRKWNTTGYFPEDLRIWKATQSRDESILLTDGLAGRFHKQRDPWSSSSRLANPIVASLQEEIAQALATNSTVGFNSSQAALKSGDGWRENGGASSWAERASSGDGGRSTSWGVDTGQSSRSFGRDVMTGPSAPLRDTSSDIKWKPGPAAGSWDPYGRSNYSSSPTRSGRADAAARFDPANWGSRSASVRPERDGWGSSQTPGNETGGYSKSAGRSSWGRGSHFRDSGGSWNPDDSSGHESSRSRATRASRKDIPCRFHQKGYCKRGDSCDFWHG